MAYNIYTTDAIVLKHLTSGDADLTLFVLTRDLGLIIASAKSARLDKSKLKGALQEYSYGSISFVRAQSIWKVTNAKSEGNFYFQNQKFGQEILARISRVLTQTIVGESPHKEIFEIVSSGFSILKDIEENDIANFEILIVLRILFELGYVAKEKNNEMYFKDPNDWGKEILDKTSKHRTMLVNLINTALKESQL